MQNLAVSLTLVITGILLADSGQQHAMKDTLRVSSADVEQLILIGRGHHDRGRYEIAEATYRVALRSNPNEAQKVNILNNLGATLIYLGRDKEALPVLLSPLRVAERVLGREHPGLSPCLNNLAVLYRDRLEHRSALKYLARAYQLSIDASPASAALTLHNMARVQYELRKDYEAARLLTESIQLLEAAEGHDSVSLVPMLSFRAQIAAESGNVAEALVLNARARDILTNSNRRAQPVFAELLSELGWLQVLTKQFQEAERSYGNALEVLRSAQAETNPAFALTMYRSAVLRTMLGEHESAVLLFRQTQAHVERVHGQLTLAVAAIASAYARALRKIGRKAEAIAVEERAEHIRRYVPAHLAKKHTVDLETLLARAK